MKDETLAAPIYHGFLPPKSRERQIDLTPRLYTQSGEKIHMAFLPLRPDCGNDPQWEDWNCYRSILAIGWPDCEQLLIPTLKQIFPVKDPPMEKYRRNLTFALITGLGKRTGNAGYSLSGIVCQVYQKRNQPFFSQSWNGLKQH